MRCQRRSGWFLLLACTSFHRPAFAQDPLALEQPTVQTIEPHRMDDHRSEMKASRTAALPTAPVTVPAGTHVLMALTSPLHTTSGVDGSGVYLETLHPVIYENQVVIPARTQVQGMVEANKRPGHVERTAEFSLRFTTLIFFNSRAVSIDGALQSVPGSKDTRVQRDDRTLSTVDQPEKVLIPTAVGAVGGAILGSVNHVGIGKFVGAGLGAGLGLGGVLLKRGDEISLPRGTYVEMVLQSPLVLDGEQAAVNAHYIPPPSAQPPSTDRNQAGQEELQKRIRPRKSNIPIWPWPAR